MTRSAIRTLLSTITGVGGQSRHRPHTDDTSAKTHSSSSVETLDHSPSAPSIIHESFAGYNIPPCRNTETIEYEMQRDALFEGGVRRLMPWRNTFKPGGLIQTLHPGCFESVAGTEESWKRMCDGFPAIFTGSSRVWWEEKPTTRPGDGPDKPYNSTLGILYVQNDKDVKDAAHFRFDDGCPADAWQRLQESITSRAEIEGTASEAPKSSRWYRRRKG